LLSTLNAAPRTFVFMPGHTPGERLRQLRARLGWSLRTAAKASEGVSYSTIKNLEDSPGAWEAVTLGTLRGIARAYGMTVDRLIAIAFDGDDAPNLADEVLKKVAALEVHPDWVAFPVYGTVDAGDIGAATPGDDEVAYIPREHLMRRGALRENIRVFHINGTCMVSDEVRRIEKNYAPGDFIAVDIDRAAQPGDVVVAWWEEKQAMVIKRYAVDRDGIQLTPLSSTRSAITLPHADLTHLLGPVVWRGG
jgi:SOS-response transcriptional repressor LexA